MRTALVAIVVNLLGGGVLFWVNSWIAWPVLAIGFGTALVSLGLAIYRVRAAERTGAGYDRPAQ
jgi:protein-S-isoprenylcysteine O-methyltransferase Ste14